MAEILHHLTCMKPCKQRNIYHINCLAGFLKHQQFITHQEKHTLAVGHIFCFVPRLLLHTAGHVWSLLRAGSVDNYTTLLWHGNLGSFLVYATGVIEDPREFAVFCIARYVHAFTWRACLDATQLHIHGFMLRNCMCSYCSYHARMSPRRGLIAVLLYFATKHLLWHKKGVSAFPKMFIWIGINKCYFKNEQLDIWIIFLLYLHNALVWRISLSIVSANTDNDEVFKEML